VSRHWRAGAFWAVWLGLSVLQGVAAVYGGVGGALAALGLSPLAWYALYVAQSYYFVLNADGSLYLERWTFLRTADRRRFLHRIHTADPGRHLHNHPWTAVCYILRGYYSCDEWDAVTGGPYEITTYGPNRPNVLRSGLWHRIRWVSPGVWTWVVAARRYREWAFLVPDETGVGRAVPWRTHLGLPADADLKD
jgi:hypothetical protein